ncbi:MAG: hypothetical protein IT481_02340 [Gammaproteobacteria bacterium]|nr:hypothetical protein [Gammaproteobacteria bacterium]
MKRNAGTSRRLAALVLPLAAVQATTATRADQAPSPAPAPRAAVQGYRIDDWQALSNEALIIRTNDGRRYRATLMSKCIGLKFTDKIAFVTRGERTVDRFAGIMLPDGSRCYFKTFEAISQPTDARDAAAR